MGLPTRQNLPPQWQAPEGEGIKEPSQEEEGYWEG